MSNKFYIVNDRAFKSKSIAIKYCLLNGLDPDESIVTTAEVETKEKYYLLITQGSNRSIRHLTWLTGTQLKTSRWIEELERLKSYEYITTFVSLNEISEREYIKVLDNLRKDYGESAVRNIISA